MYISQLKKEENIAEYVLYMWQIEDVIRACNFDVDKITQIVIAKDLEESELLKFQDWYANLINHMKIQGIEKQGHLYDINEVLMELTYLHNSLLDHFNDEKYKQFYSFAEQFIDDFKKVSNNPNIGPVEVCFNALYGKLILKLQNKSISEETEQAFEAFRNVLAYLSVKYNLMKSGQLV
jgi:hypothetical protein